jgi:hypothetical protein
MDSHVEPEILRSGRGTPIANPLCMRSNVPSCDAGSLDSSRAETCERHARRFRTGIMGGAWALLAFVAMHAGCGSGSSSSVEACATTPTPPAQDDYCTGLASYYGRCGHCQDCTEKNLGLCTQRGSMISSAYRAAFLGCKDAIPCTGVPGADPGGEPSFSPCVEEAMRTAIVTTAQTQAKTAYCTACGATNAADCASFFSVDSPAGKNGPGYNVLLYNDDLAMMAATTCSSHCDPVDYGICVALLFCSASGGDFCSNSGFCAVHGA